LHFVLGKALRGASHAVLQLLLLLLQPLLFLLGRHQLQAGLSMQEMKR
jgi:hypothetical protein